jgi:membrane fusion protein (multidrug efflux system)
MTFRIPKTKIKIVFLLCIGIISSSIFGYRLFFARNYLTNKEKDIKVVEVENVGIKDIQQTIRLIGTIKPKNTTLVAQSSGILVCSTQPGQNVNKGTIIAKINNREVEKNHELAEARVEINKVQYERLLPLEKVGHASKGMVEERKKLWIEAQQKLADARIVLDKIRIYAPFDGIIGIFKTREGTHVQEGDSIVSFYDPTSLIVEFAIPSSVMAFVQENQPTIIDGKTYELTKVQKMVDEETHMSPAFVYYPCNKCVVGTEINVDLVVQHKKGVIVIPFEAVFLRNGKTFVYLVNDNAAVLTPVELGIRAKDKVEIKSGLSQGDVLITKGQARLYPAIPVKVYQPDPRSPSSGQK